MNDIRHPDHLKSCRVCLEKFTQNEKQILITNILKKQYFDFTNIEVIEENLLKRFIYLI